MNTRWLVSFAALLFCACSSRPPAGQDPAAVEAAPLPASTGSAPATPAAGGPALSYAVLDPKMEGELPVRWLPVFSGPPRTGLEGGVLWAPAAAVVRVLAPEARVTFAGGHLQIDGETTAVPARLEGGEAWAAVAPLARRFGAYARVHEEDGSVAIWPRDALLWLRDHGDPGAPVLREAKAAGLLGPPGS